jgi:hypothetical protein
VLESVIRNMTIKVKLIAEFVSLLTIFLPLF